MASMRTNERYWEEYSNIQSVKHALVKSYLDGWFPKMALGKTGEKQLLYVDTHAGRGKHEGGQVGSPVIAIESLLKHQASKQILERSQVHFRFFERDNGNAAILQSEIDKIALPTNVTVKVRVEDSFQAIDDGIKRIEANGDRVPPSFIFVDPFGFKIPIPLLTKLFSYPKVELFINVIWRELDMAMKYATSSDDAISIAEEPRPQLFESDDEPQSAASREKNKIANLNTLNQIFGCEDWRRILAKDSDERANECAGLVTSIVGAKWGTHLCMLDNGRIRYFLLHLSNSDHGRDLMKKCMWKLCPHGVFSASRTDNPNQKLLMSNEDDIVPVIEWIRAQLSDKPMKYSDLADRIRETFWLDTQLNRAITEMAKERSISWGEGIKPVFKKNPLLCLNQLLL